MQFASTRGGTPLGFSAALQQGLAPDGGLYVPATWPAQLEPAALLAQAGGEPAALVAVAGLARLANAFIGPFAEGDVLAAEIGAITAEAFSFPAPLVAVGNSGRLSVLELFHGPTAAFKDFGARFLAATLVRLRRGAARPLRILVATSGDTGGAVAAAFHRKRGIEVAVLFPKGLVSPTQQQQLTCWGDNVRSFAVRGSFDDCQRLVKQAFLDEGMRAGCDLSSANSINLGRLLPQAVYYLAASLAVQARTGQQASFVIPSGNLGNATACIWARRLGAPIDEILLAHNANRTLPDYLAEGVLRTRASVATLASAMDVGAPSNLERLSALYPDAATLGGALSAVSIDDAAISARIRSDRQRYGQVWCPHTATAAEAWARMAGARRDAKPWVLVATAHPAKFREIVEPLVGEPVPLPAHLARLFELPARFQELDPGLAALRTALEAAP
jgi:threonine synthase